MRQARCRSFWKRAEFHSECGKRLVAEDYCIVLIVHSDKGGGDVTPGVLASLFLQIAVELFPPARPCSLPSGSILAVRR